MSDTTETDKHWQEQLNSIPGAMDWAKSKDENLKQAFAQGYNPIISNDSLLRPSNLGLWIDMKKAEGSWNLDQPTQWQFLMDNYQKRLDRDNLVGEGLRKDPAKYEPMQLNPWLMLQEKARSGDTGKPY
jgi:hypothetical protein